VTDPLTSPAPTERAGPGTMVAGRYELLAAIGHGGMGSVWRATDTVLNRSVAVKEVAPPPNVSAEERDSMYERLLREARAAAVLSHPSVVQVYDVVTDGRRPWVVMELLDARSMAEIVLNDGPLAPRAAAKIGVAILGALEVAHAAGVLHRDVKPANVLICSDGRCVLTDFGVARTPTDSDLTTPGMVLGSPHFISPERALGAAFGPPSDLFSLGVSLYTAVEGKAPFDRGDPIATMHAIVEDEPPPPERAGALTPVLYGLLDKDPERRWDAATARNRLRDLLAGPLASRTPMYPTDPQAIFNPQWSAPPAVVSGAPRVGGRAMLGPDDDPYSAVEDSYRQLPDPYQLSGAAAPAADPAGTPTWSGSWHQPDAARHGSGRGRRGRARRGRTSRSPSGGGGLTGMVMSLPTRTRVAMVGGLGVLLLVGMVWALPLGGGGPDTPPAGQAATPAPTASAPADEPLLPVQQFADRGFVVNLPHGWEQTANTEIRVDYADPDDGGARLRLLQEPSGADAMRFIEIIEPNLSCPDPYQRVDLTETQIAGTTGALLEYTCGAGDEARHTLWATVVRDETAYSFYLSVPADQFADRRVVFDEMLRSFQFAD
jgi:eukaryotic-like serine/threonine-protein kinase